MRIAVTGAAGYVGGCLLRRLLNEQDVEQIIGIDVRPIEIGGENLTTCTMDVQDPGLGEVLGRYRVDAVVHAAFVLFPPPRRLQWMADVNIGGTANLLRAAGQAGVRHILFLSSATVYGAWPDNPVPMTEEHPPRPNPDYPYAVHKQRAETLIRQFGQEHPEVTWTILRPPGIVGPHLTGPLARLWRRSRSIIIDGGRSPGQFIHEEDLVDLIIAALRARAGGVFNATPDDWVPWRDLWPAAGKPTLNIPWTVGYPLFGLLWYLGALGCATHPGQVRMARYPFVATNARARQTLNWAPRYTTVEALRIFYMEADNGPANGLARGRDDGADHH